MHSGYEYARGKLTLFYFADIFLVRLMYIVLTNIWPNKNKKIKKDYTNIAPYRFFINSRGHSKMTSPGYGGGRLVPKSIDKKWHKGKGDMQIVTSTPKKIMY